MYMQLLDEDEAVSKKCQLKPRLLVRMSDTRWNYLFSVLRRFHSMSEALSLLYRSRLSNMKGLPADKVT